MAEPWPVLENGDPSASAITQEQEEVLIEAIPSDFTITSQEVRQIQEKAGQTLDLGTEGEAAVGIFNRSEDFEFSTQRTASTVEREQRRPLLLSSRLQSEWWTDRLDGEVRIRFGESGAAAEPAETIIQVFERVVAGYGEHTALAVKREGEWKQWSYKKYYDDCITAGKAFIELGLEPYHSVCILGFNAPEWFISNMGAIMAGGISVGLYITSSPEACCTVAFDSQANIIVVENDSQLQKILQVRDQLPHLKTIVQYTKMVTENEENVKILDWKQFMQLGTRTQENKLNERMAQIRPNKCCTLVYTSGTSGQPKGTMLSHDNFIWICRRVMRETQNTLGEEHIVSYLPLSHIATQLLDIYVTLVSAGTCWFAQPDALKGSLLQTLKEVHPTIFLGVPRVWEKIAESMQMVAQNTTGLKARIASWSKSVGLKGNVTKQTGGSGTPFGWSLANWLFFKKVRQALGLDRCHFPMNGAAPLGRDTQSFFMSVNIPIHEIYGMSETTGPATVTTADKIKYKSSGTASEGTELRIDNPDEYGNGEVLIRGRHVFMGYLGLPEATRDSLNEEGWLRSGDIGYLDKDGFLFITGRKKEILVTAGGEKIAPVALENTIKHELPIVSHAMVIGDRQKFLSCLITLKVELNDHGVPTNQLSPVAVAACQRVGSSALTVDNVLEGGGDERVLKMIQKGIDNANKRAASKAQKIAKWSILEEDFSIATGELTPTLKLKRRDIMLKYAHCIESFYNIV